MVDLVNTIDLHLIRIILPIIICSSLIGNILNVIILTRYKLRKHACTLYFTAISINNLIYSSIMLIPNLLDEGYGIEFVNMSTVTCKLFSYIGTLLSILSPSFMVLASIDRWCASSSNISRRFLSNARTAKWLMFIVILFFSFVFIISLIKTELNKYERIKCYLQSDEIFIQIYGILQFIIFSVLAPLLMSIFGFLTICNIQRYHRAFPTSYLRRRRETQLVRMLLVQVAVQLALIFPFSVTVLLLHFPSIYQPTPTFYSLFRSFRVIFHISYATSFFLYILSSATFRKELRVLVRKILLSCYVHHRIENIRCNTIRENQRQNIPMLVSRF